MIVLWILLGAAGLAFGLPLFLIYRNWRNERDAGPGNASAFEKAFSSKDRG